MSDKQSSNETDGSKDRSKTETEIANQIIENNPKYDFEVEAHYNHYGSRGVVDLVERGGLKTNVYEIKSESALDSVTGANEIVRQFNKHQEFFHKGYSGSLKTELFYFLLFDATKKTLTHIFENRQIYDSIKTKKRNADHAVCVYRDGIGIVPVLIEEIWQNDVQAIELRNELGLSKEVA